MGMFQTYKKVLGDEMTHAIFYFLIKKKKNNNVQTANSISER